MEADPPKAEPPKRKRRWFQFSLRSLMMLALLVGVGMASWIVPIKNRAERQKAAVEAIVKNGGSVVYDYQFDASNKWIRGGEPPAPAWLRKLLGDNFFTNVIGAFITTDGDSEFLDDLPRLKRLQFGDVQISDAVLEHVGRLTNLQYLDLGRTHVTDVGTKHLIHLTSLQTLMLSGMPITDAGVEHLGRLNEVEWQITKAMSLMLEPKTDTTAVMDLGLAQLDNLTQLKTLILNGNNRISDAGLLNLRGLPQLQSLWLPFTIVTDAGVHDLQHALPNCKIYR